MVLTVGDDVWGAVFRIQCAFPKMEGVAMLKEKSMRENHIGQCFQGTGHISKYGKYGYPKFFKKTNE